VNGGQGRKHVGKEEVLKKEPNEGKNKQTEKQVVKNGKEILEGRKGMKTKEQRKEKRNQLSNAF
jgi:hypothetical protein